MSTRKGNDGERTKVLFGEFLRGPCRAEVLGFDIDLISNFEVRSWEPPGVRRTLITLLHGEHFGAEEVVELREFDGVVASAFGGEIGVREDGEVRVVTLVGEERRDTSGRARSVIVSELREGEDLGPVVLLVVTVDAEVLLEGLVGMLCLPIPLRVASGGEVELHVEGFTKRAEEVGDEFQTSIGGGVSGYSVFGEDVGDKELS